MAKKKRKRSSAPTGRRRSSENRTEVRLYPDPIGESIDLLMAYVETALGHHRASKQAHQRATAETDASRRDNCARHADEWHKRSMESAASALEYAQAHLRRLTADGLEPSEVYRLTYRLQLGEAGLDALNLEWPEIQAVLRAQRDRLTGSAPPPTDLITQAEAARIIACSEDTIRRRIRDGTLTPYGPLRRVSKAEVEQKRDLLVRRRPRSVWKK